MQTFLPFPDFAQSAKCLDRQRLGKQRSECEQILQTLLGESNGWRHHPAVKMWRGYERTLATYAVAICEEWRARGYRDTMLRYFQEHADDSRMAPPWLGDPAFHRSHQSNLIRKLPAHYGPLFPGVPDNLPYVWPVR